MMADATINDGSGPAMRWFGLFGAAIAWLAHLLLAYGTAEFGCVGGWAQRAALGFTVVAWAAILISLVLMVVAVAATCTAYIAVRRPVSLEDSGRPNDWMVKAGFLTSAIFTLIIAVQSVPIIFHLNRC